MTNICHCICCNAMWKTNLPDGTILYLLFIWTTRSALESEIRRLNGKMLPLKVIASYQYLSAHVYFFCGVFSSLFVKILGSAFILLHVLRSVSKVACAMVPFGKFCGSACKGQQYTHHRFADVIVTPELFCNLHYYAICLLPTHPRVCAMGIAMQARLQADTASADLSVKVTGKIAEAEGAAVNRIQSEIRAMQGPQCTQQHSENANTEHPVAESGEDAPDMTTSGQQDIKSALHKCVTCNIKIPQPDCATYVADKRCPIGNTSCPFLCGAASSGTDGASAAVVDLEDMSDLKRKRVIKAAQTVQTSRSTTRCNMFSSRFHSLVATRLHIFMDGGNCGLVRSHAQICIT